VAVNSLTASIEEGETTGLIGPNGSGKTTLINLVSGYYKPDSGKIIYGGLDIVGKKVHTIARMGLLRTFQLSRPLMDKTVRDNIIIGSIFAGGAKTLGEARNVATEICEMVGLTPKADELASNLTFPERKMLEIARALAAKPKMLLLDEPMAGLNPTEINSAIKLLRSLQAERGVTLLVVEHVMQAVIGLCDHVLVMSGGSKIAEGKPQDVLQDERVINVYLRREPSTAPS
jgi:branched-chain amino acid transport system ATP-binding protein